MVYSTERTVKEAADKNGPSRAGSHLRGRERYQRGAAGHDVDRIRKAEKQLTQIGRRLTETLYKNTTDSGQNGKASDVPPGAPGSEKDVVDAEYQDVV